MAHELLIEGGNAAMMYVGETPWHGLGTALDAPPTAAEAIVAAGLDWRVVKKPLCAVADGIWYEIPEKYAVVREDRWGTEDCPIFGTVSENYVPLQNREAFSFFDSVIQSKTATYETAGALGQGERVWVTAKLKEDVEIVKGDRLQRYILLANGHNAATALRILFTPIRVVCQNTLNWALEGSKHQIRIYHGPDMYRRLEAAKEMVSHITEHYREVGEQFTSMAKRQMLNGAPDAYFEKVFPTPERGRFTEKNYERLVDECKGRRAACTELFEAGRGTDIPGVRGTLWAAYNGVTELADHRMRYKSRHQRFGSLFFGESARIKERALSEAVVILGQN
jgi:phage/plasmid-like protein (TIGR03299 family)